MLVEEFAKKCNSEPSALSAKKSSVPFGGWFFSGLLLLGLCFLSLVTIACQPVPSSSSIEPPTELQARLAVSLPQGQSLDLIYCPPGTFTMGSPLGEVGRESDEQLHQVKLTKGFYLGKYELTRDQYCAVITEKASSLKGDGRRPIDGLNWDEAIDFCQRLNDLTQGQLPKGFEFALPTEAQWEYACRAGTNTSLNNGQNLTSALNACPNLDKLVWYLSNSKKLQAVGQKQANAWGFFDMHGNVWEWCSDRYGKYQPEATDPRGHASCFQHLGRGGSSLSMAKSCRSAARFFFDPGIGYDGLGLRVAAEPLP